MIDSIYVKYSYNKIELSIIQINFQESHEKYIVNPNDETITKIQTNGSIQMNTIQFTTLASKEFVILNFNIFKYITSVIEFLSKHLSNGINIVDL